MGADKQDYEKGIGITKSADRRMKRTIRKMNKRYKLRRNKLLYVLHELGMLPEQIRFKHPIPEPTRIQELTLMPIEKKTLQLDSLAHYKLRASAIDNIIDLKDFGRILYQFNQLRGYAGGFGDEDTSVKKNENSEIDTTKKRYEVVIQKVLIDRVEKSTETFKVKGGQNKGQQLNKYNVAILIDGEKLEGETELQNLEEKIGKGEELEIRIKRNKKGETTSVIFALPQKTSWRKEMEVTEDLLKKESIFISQLFVRELERDKWTKIRNRVVLRSRYQQEFDKIWETQSQGHSILNDCPRETLERIATYLFPGEKESQSNLRREAVSGGLRHIIRNQIIYFQRPLKSQAEFINHCQFERDEKALPSSHPLFQEFRCWDQINRMYITSKRQVWNDKRKKYAFEYVDRFLTHEEKFTIYNQLQTQKQISYGEVVKITKLKNSDGEYLNGLNFKATLKGCDTKITITKILSDYSEEPLKYDNDDIVKIWKVIFYNANNGSEYDPTSIRVSTLIEVLQPLIKSDVTDLALKIAQQVKFPRKYASLSEKAIKNILPMMQLNPRDLPEKAKQTFHLITTGEIVNGFQLDQLEDYVVSFVRQNPNALDTGGLMYAFASSLIYGKHTQTVIKPQVKTYHEIKYEERNLRNPIVSQLTNETMQVVKALWKQYKLNPEDLEIRIELARDLKNSAAEREKIYNSHVKNQKANEQIKQKLIELKQELTPGNIELYKLWSGQSIEEYPSPKKINAPTEEEIQKLRLWEEQKCISPYTLKPIPLSKLFSPERLFDIDHIIPKSRYFDDSLSNKVVCETNINWEKANRTAWEYISQQNSRIGICSETDYIKHVDEIFYGRKKKNLLAEKIPANLVERQIKDTQYISVMVKNELAKIVGSESVKTSTGEVTSFLRTRWGLRKLFMELTERRFDEMKLWDINPETGKPNTKWVEKFFDKDSKKHIYKIKNWSKRYDNRHHAVDALVVALTEQSHIQRLNNLNKYLQEELIKRSAEFKLDVAEDENILDAYFNLSDIRRKEIQTQIESSRFFEIPFENLIEQTRAHLETMIISIKPKDKLGVNRDQNGRAQLKIRGALHKETNYGKTKAPFTGTLRDTRAINLSELTARDVPQIIDEVLKKEITAHFEKYDSMKEAFTGEGLKAFNEGRFQTKKPTKRKPPVYKIKVWYSKEADGSTLQRLYDDNEKLSVVTGDNYLFLVMEKNGKRIFDIASLYDSADIAKRALKEGIENFKIKICDDHRAKHKDKPDKVLFTLQQGDLVYFPENADDPVLKLNTSELKSWLLDYTNKKKFSQRVYRVAKFTGKDCFFIPHNYANAISVPKDLTEAERSALKKKYKDRKIPKVELNFVEYGSYRDCSPYEPGAAFVQSVTGPRGRGERLVKIQSSCIKISSDWLGNIIATTGGTNSQVV